MNAFKYSVSNNEKILRLTQLFKFDMPTGLAERKLLTDCFFVSQLISVVTHTRCLSK